ncbi:hypothetical protein D3C84_557980 [compost metagenome]
MIRSGFKMLYFIQPNTKYLINTTPIAILLCHIDRVISSGVEKQDAFSTIIIKNTTTLTMHFVTSSGVEMLFNLPFYQLNMGLDSARPDKIIITLLSFCHIERIISSGVEKRDAFLFFDNHCHKPKYSSNALCHIERSRDAFSI